MRIARVAILVVMTCSMLTGCDSCTKKKVKKIADIVDTTAVVPPAGTVCNGTTCKTVVYVNAECKPVDGSNADMNSAKADKGGTICFFNKGSADITLTFPTGMIQYPAVPGIPQQEYKLAPGECASFETTPSDSTYGYQITGTACDGSHGNPDVIVGGGSGGGGSGGGGG